MIQKNKNIVLRNIHGLHFLIDITENFLDEKCELFEVDPIGAFIWNALDKNDTPREISLRLQEVLTEDIPIELLLSDVNDFIYSLKAQNFVTEN